MDNTTTLMSHLIHNPHDINSCSFLQDILKEEDYVIYFYLKNNYSEGLGMNRDLLSMSLDKNAPTWVDERSILFKEGRMTLDYIKVNVDDALLTPTDYSNAFKQLVLNRYDELVAKKDDTFNLQDSLPVIREYVESALGRILMDEMVELVRTGRWHKNKKYSSADIIPYLRTRLEEIDTSATKSTDSDSYGTSVTSSYAQGAYAYSLCFDWNLGQNINLPKVHRGYVVSLVGQEKVGKTKFALGEMAYNTIRAGGNVVVYSGEMSEIIVRTILIIKHIYAVHGYKLEHLEVLDFLTVHFMFLEEGITLELFDKEVSRRRELRRGSLSASTEPLIRPDLMQKLSSIRTSIKTYREMEDVDKEVVLSAFDDFFLSNKYGKIIIYKQEDGVFNVETLLPTAKAHMAQHDAWMWILDHTGFVESDTGLNKVDIFTKTYQITKAVAENKEQPVASVPINHLETSANDNIRSGKDPATQALRAHGSSEARKTADVEFILYATPEDAREGLIKIWTSVSRHEAGLSVPATLVADRAANDFVGIGSSKVPYPDGIEETMF